MFKQHLFQSYRHYLKTVEAVFFCEFTSNVPFMLGCAVDVSITLLSVISTLLAFERGSSLILTLETICAISDTISADVDELVISSILPDVGCVLIVGCLASPARSYKGNKIIRDPFFSFGYPCKRRIFPRMDTACPEDKQRVFIQSIYGFERFV